MTVGAISTSSSRYVYSTYTEYQYFGTTVPQERLNALMARYGVRQTGDSEKDLRALYAVLYRESVTEIELEKSTEMPVNQVNKPENTKQAENTVNVPWATLMGQVGLMVTGDFATDYAAFETRINSMQQFATASPQEKASIDQLVAEAAVVFVPPEQSAIQAAPSQAQANPETKPLSGAEIQAQLNRLFLTTG